MEKVFITYDGEELALDTALRMQTISFLYNYKVYLPTRKFKDVFTSSTKDKIADSDIVIAFILGKDSNALVKELDFARKKGKPIIIVSNDELPGSLAHLRSYDKLMSVKLNQEDPDETLHKIANYLKNLKRKKTSVDYSSLISAVAIMIGLLVLALAITDEE